MTVWAILGLQAGGFASYSGRLSCQRASVDWASPLSSPKALCAGGSSPWAVAFVSGQTAEQSGLGKQEWSLKPETVRWRYYRCLWERSDNVVMGE